MLNTEHYILQGIFLRLLYSLSPEDPEAMFLVMWIYKHPEIFGVGSPPVRVGRYKPKVAPEYWQAVADRISTQLEYNDPPDNKVLHRLEAISARLGLLPDEESILTLLVINTYSGSLSQFFKDLQKNVGLSIEAALGWCCNLNDIEVWKVLSLNSQLLKFGLILRPELLSSRHDHSYEVSRLLLLFIKG